MDQKDQLIAKVYHYFEQEYEELKRTIPGIEQSALAQLRQRTARATGVSETAVADVLAEEARRNEVRVKEEKRRSKEPLLVERKTRIRSMQDESSGEECNYYSSDEDNDDRFEATETLVIKEEPLELEYEEPAEPAFLNLPSVKEEPASSEDPKELVDPIAVNIKKEPGVKTEPNEEEATTEEKQKELKKELKRKRNRERQRAYYHRQKNLKRNEEKKRKKKVPKTNAERQREFRQRQAEKFYVNKKRRKVCSNEEKVGRGRAVENIENVTLQENQLHSQQFHIFNKLSSGEECNYYSSDEDNDDRFEATETLVIKEEPLELEYEEPAEPAFLNLPSVKEEPASSEDPKELVDPIAVNIKKEPGVKTEPNEEEATTSNGTTGATTSIKKRKIKTEAPPATSSSPTTSSPPKRRLIETKDIKVKVEKEEIKEEGNS